MAEAIGVISGVVTLVATASKSCRVLLGTLNSIKEAPKYIGLIARDLEDF